MTSHKWSVYICSQIHASVSGGLTLMCVCVCVCVREMRRAVPRQRTPAFALPRFPELLVLLDLRCELMWLQVLVFSTEHT